MALMILFWWPGLSCNFEIGNWLKVERVHSHEPARADVDQARFKIGLAEIAKEEGVSFYRRERGFEKVDDSTRTGFTYVGDSVILTVFVLKNWHQR